MQNPALSAGDPIAIRCPKCRKNTDHTIATMAGERPADVQCNTCNRRHKYRPPAGTAKPSVNRTINEKAAERKEWQTLRPNMNSAEATDYSMTAAYKARALINHPVFGLGLVQRIVGPQKVQVLFEDGKKTMRCK